ncbi:hypothetical protein [Botrimarina mediterranea]|uniref:hypothetical protein n=1 Tax=Botrimarina mediterranea TaxID=2528022 RepID=UPI0011A8B6DB
MSLVALQPTRFLTPILTFSRPVCFYQPLVTTAHEVHLEPTVVRPDGARLLVLHTNQRLELRHRDGAVRQGVGQLDRHLPTKARRRDVEHWHQHLGVGLHVGRAGVNTPQHARQVVRADRLEELTERLPHLLARR